LVTWDAQRFQCPGAARQDFWNHQQIAPAYEGLDCIRWTKEVFEEFVKSGCHSNEEEFTWDRLEREAVVLANHGETGR